MCGPLAAVARGNSRRGALPYALGRLCSYTLLGSLAGSVGRVLHSLRWAEALLSWLFAAALLFAAVRLLGGRAPSGLIKLGRGPRSNRVGRALSRIADEPMLLGAASALLPCAALWAALMAAAAQASSAHGALTMATFAVLSGVALSSFAQLSRLSTLGVHGRRALAAIMVVGALITMWRPLPGLSGSAPACHSPHGALRTGAGS